MKVFDVARMAIQKLFTLRYGKRVTPSFALKFEIPSKMPCNSPLLTLFNFVLPATCSTTRVHVPLLPHKLF